MKIQRLLLLSFLSLSLLTCAVQEQYRDTRARQVKPSEVTSYHAPIEIKIAWYPYQDQVLKQTSRNEWKLVKSDTGRQSQVPVILIKYPLQGDSIWLDMNTESEVLGKILKHSLMTQEVIQRPFTSFLERASCNNCHPSDIEVDFNR